MTAKEILELVRAGYSKREIDAMSDETSAHETNTENDPQPTETRNDAQGSTAPVQTAPAPVVPVQPAQAETAPAIPARDADRLAALERNLAALVAAVQNNNRRDVYQQATIIGPDEAALGVMRELSGAPSDKKEVNSNG